MSSNSTFDALLEQYLERGTEISRLEAENARLREAASEVVRRMDEEPAAFDSSDVDVLRAALETTRPGQAPDSAKPEVDVCGTCGDEDNPYPGLVLAKKQPHCSCCLPEYDPCPDCTGKKAPEAKR